MSNDEIRLPPASPLQRRAPGPCAGANQDEWDAVLQRIPREFAPSDGLKGNALRARWLGWSVWHWLQVLHHDAADPTCQCCECAPAQWPEELRTNARPETGIGAPERQQPCLAGILRQGP